ncbi:MAG: CocE/NonD family hydrolase [Nocardioidaceae bacterium]|nr:CocE/NonD family hydrolase [Nocardioidaceae bacterium]MCL2612962.1 CocE/NonD family hydrolase [Nocardioidaceae bacterium]
MKLLARPLHLAPVVALAMTAGLAATAGHADAQPAARQVVARASAPRASTTWRPRPEQWHQTVTEKDLEIPMSDGTVLRGDLTLPATADGRAVQQRLPVILTITAYNKTVIEGAGGAVLAGADPSYLVKRGYAQLDVDARGTGDSPGRWCAFCTREDKDAGEIVAWAHRQSWSDGKVGMTGASYMGIDQLFAAEDDPPGLKAIFPQVPAADVYRDVVASGGQIDVGFIPLWLGLVSATGAIPPAYSLSDPQSALQMALDHIEAGATFTTPLMLQALLGGYPAYDGPFYRQRSPITNIKRIHTPAFFVGGEYDLFQRGTGMDFDALQRQGVATKMILGPWDHLQGSSGAQVGNAGYGSLAQLQLRWFDHYLKGKDTQLGRISPLTYYEQGTGRWATSKTWIGKEERPATYKLSGSATLGSDNGGLTTGRPKAGKSLMQPLPVSGLCTRSSDQWTAGLPNMLMPKMPCFTDNRLNDKSGLVFQTAPVKRTVRIQGPIDAHLNVSTSTGDGLLAVTVEDVAPNGTVSRLTGGWQVVSQRALDKSRSRYLDGRMIQPFHPFLKSTRKALKPGTIAPVDVEVFPTGAAIKPGHRLRVAVEGFDVPHLLAPLPDLVGQLGPLTIYSGGAHTSYVTLPTR